MVLLNSKHKYQFVADIGIQKKEAILKIVINHYRPPFYYKIILVDEV